MLGQGTLDNKETNFHANKVALNTVRVHYVDTCIQKQAERHSL